MSFKAAAASIAKRQGEPIANAKAELAAATRRAGPAGRKKNPKLNRVKGKAKPSVKGSAKPAKKVSPMKEKGGKKSSAKRYAPSPIGQAMGVQGMKDPGMGATY